MNYTLSAMFLLKGGLRAQVTITTTRGETHGRDTIEKQSGDSFWENAGNRRRSKEPNQDTNLGLTET